MFVKIILLSFLDISSSSAQEVGQFSPVNLRSTQASQVPGPSLSIVTYDNQNQAPATCDNFINRNGELGAWGQRLIRATKDVNQNCFYERIDFSGVCPNYSRFSQARKEQYIAFLFASIAAFESSCRPNAQVRGTNDTADGLFQLEYSQRWRANAGRNARFCATNRGVNTQDINFQMECAASIFSDHYCRSGRVVGARTGGYWQKLNRSNGLITRLARRFPHCGN
jgi:hypothetical protein